MTSFDVFIIGTGTAGATAADDLRKAGLSVAIADNRPYGGTCALRGCQPKKYLVVPAHAALEGAALTERGFSSAPTLDWKKMQRARASFTDGIPESSERSMQDNGIATFHCRCSLVDKHTIDCDGQRFEANSIILATGARPRPLDIPGGELARTSDDFLYMSELPEEIVFIGGGYVSLEFATVASALGRKVTVVHSGDRIMKRFSPEIVPDLSSRCASRGIELKTSLRPVEISQNGDRYTVLLTDGSTIESDVVFAAVGRVPNVENLGLENAGVEYDERGISVTTQMKTTSPGIYAIGDCTQTIQLAPVSDHEAHTAAANIVANGDGPSIDYDLIPTVVFTYPQMAQVGRTDPGHDPDIEVISGSGAGWANYRRLNDSDVRYRVIKRKSTDAILGASLLAPQAGELINAFAMIIKSGMTAAQVKLFPWAYPTYLSDIKYMVG
jgi:glutathione reductase (NADPH)